MTYKIEQAKKDGKDYWHIVAPDGHDASCLWHKDRSEAEYHRELLEVFFGEKK